MQVDPIRVTFPLTDRAFIQWRENVKRFFAYLSATAARKRELKARQPL